jgi:predicted kinase
VLVIFRGLPGTGKTTLARLLVQRRPALLVLSRDVIRRALIHAPSYSPEEKELVDALIASMSGFLLDRGRDVVIDGMALSSAAGVDRLVRVAAARNVPARIVECVCRQETALARIRGDEGRHPAADRGEALYFSVKARFQPAAYPVLTVDTDREASLAVNDLVEYLDRPAESP